MTEYMDKIFNKFGLIPVPKFETPINENLNVVLAEEEILAAEKPGDLQIVSPAYQYREMLGSLRNLYSTHTVLVK